MTRTRLLADDRVISMATIAMTLVALTTAMTELDGKTYGHYLCVIYLFSSVLSLKPHKTVLHMRLGISLYITALLKGNLCWFI